MEKKYPKILIVSNNSFSKVSNNGRILGNLFIEWPKDKIAQFCISTTNPDYEICDNYYVVSDNSIVKAFLYQRKAQRCNIEDILNSEGKTQIVYKKVQRKTITKSLIRNILWGKDRWESKVFLQWVDAFEPECVLVYNSDSFFIHRIGMSIANRWNIPLVMYNTEGYYFFRQNYLGNNSLMARISFFIYQHIYRKWFKLFMKKVSLVVHLNEKLAEDYRNEFDGRHLVSRGATTIAYNRLLKIPEFPKFTYLGNFSYNRAYSLVEIANTLNQIDNRYKLTVYGHIPTDEVKQVFGACRNIVFGGFVSYEKVQDIMLSSTILFHAESQSDTFEEGVKYGFSSKIPDSIASGRPFLIYASKNVAGAQYLADTKAGWSVSTLSDLKSAIKEILYDDIKRNEILDNAKEIALKNHNVRRLGADFRSLIYDTVNNKNNKINKL